MLQGAVACLPHGIELEQGVEVHELYAGDVVDLLSGHDLAEVFLHAAHSVRVAIGQRVAQQGAVLTDTDKVDAPGVDADARDVELPGGCQLQAANDFVVYGVDVPIVVSACLDKVVVEAGEFLLFQFAVLDGAQDCPSACRSQVCCEKVLLHVRMFFTLQIYVNSSNKRNLWSKDFAECVFLSNFALK